MFFPLYKWLCKLHVVPPPNLSIYGEMIFIPHPANAYTYLRNLYEDFGMLGVAVVPFLLGAVTSALRTRACRYFHNLNLYVILLAFILFSFYNYSLFSNQVYLQILFAFIFFRYEFKSIHEAPS